MDKIAIAQGHQFSSQNARFATAKKILEKTDCNACHKSAEKSIGPSYRDVALKYKDQGDAISLLSGRVIKGSTGVWGQVAMAAHPALSPDDAAELIKYILSHADEKAHPAPLPVKGEYVAAVPPGDKGVGVYILRAAYRDRGVGELPALEAEKVYVLQNPALNPHAVDYLKDAQKMSFSGMKFCIPSGKNAHMGYKALDLTGIKRVQYGGSAPAQYRFTGSRVEMRLDKPDGPLAGAPVDIQPFEGSGFQQQAPVNILLNQGATGIHDVYFVFKNDTADAAGALMTVQSIVFQDEASAALADAPPPAPAADQISMEDYVGQYKFTGLPFETIEVKIEDGKLVTITPMGSGPITPTGLPETFDAGGQAQFQFIRENGKVSGVKLMPPGMSFTGIKL